MTDGNRSGGISEALSTTQAALVAFQVHEQEAELKVE